MYPTIIVHLCEREEKRGVYIQRYDLTRSAGANSQRVASRVTLLVASGTNQIVEIKHEATAKNYYDRCSSVLDPGLLLYVVILNLTDGVL